MTERASRVGVGSNAQMPPVDRRLQQADLIRYAGASGDFNPLHWDQARAAEVSPTGGVIVHGMLNLAVLVDVVSTWLGADHRVAEIDVSFRAPCPVDSVVTFHAEAVEGPDADGRIVLRVGARLEGGDDVIDPKRSTIAAVPRTA